MYMVIYMTTLRVELIPPPNSFARVGVIMS